MNGYLLNILILFKFSLLQMNSAALIDLILFQNNTLETHPIILAS